MRALALAGLLLLSSRGRCEDCKGPELEPPADAAVADAKPLPLVPVQSATPARTAPRGTPPVVTGPALIESVDRRLASAKGADLADARLQHARITGDVEDLVLALAAIDSAIAIDARIAIHRITRARLLLELGRMVEAEEALAKAKELGATADELDPVQGEIDWASGRVAAAAEAIRRVASHPQSGVLAEIRKGRLEHDMGNEDAADRTLDGAENRLNDALGLADTYTQHGFDKLDIGKPEEARVWFEAANAQLATSRAKRGLAETLDRLGKKSEAIALLGPESKDLDLLLVLARLAPQHRQAARVRLNALLAKTPEAVQTQAARFYLELDPDPKRAVDFASRAAKASPTAANLALLARAQLESGDAAAARTSIEAALRVPVASARVAWTAARVYARLGESGKADELAARARRRNPRIESDEPPIKK